LFLLLPGFALAAGNTAYGSQACSNVTSGSFNNCFGDYSGWTNTTGSYNVFIGVDAGFHTSTDGNTFVGGSAGFRNTAGTQNTFVGDQSGPNANDSTGSYNTYLGASAGFYNTSGFENVFVGYLSGPNNTTGYKNTFIGKEAGRSNTDGHHNAYLGEVAGFSNTTGSFNAFLGPQAGYNNLTGSFNVFIGNAAGFNELGSDRLYIDNCRNGAPCSSPFIYGEFDNHLLNINGVTSVAANNVARSQLHFSLNNADSGGFLTSVLDNNFFMSSGARYDASAGGWIQRSPDQQSVIQGSGSLGYRVFTSSGHATGTTFTPAVRLLIDYNGLFALNANSTVAGHEIHTSSGAYLTTSGTWTNASSRDYKDAIAPLTADAAEKTLAALEPVTFHYKNDMEQQRVGFIAEDVPELVAMKDRKGLSPMDIVAVLTKVAQEQRRQLEAERSSRERMEELLRRQLQQLAEQVARLQVRAGN
jgi:hypothetical protein